MKFCCCLNLHGVNLRDTTLSNREAEKIFQKKFFAPLENSSSRLKVARAKIHALADSPCP
jgi:hypothetical protein